jgi:formylglycine-generating enzyme required for sulfatase activity
MAYTAFRIEGGLVFAMEYVEGLDLARLVRARGPLSVAHACSFIHQAALGLQHAHEKGMVHRDIKPHNLMLGHDGGFPLVKVLDFGLAKAARDPVVETALTSEGQALGTPDFIAPEQITNQPGLDVRADLYSLGATFFYLLAGRPPFRSGSLHEIYHAHMSRQAEALNLVRGDVPPSLASLVARLMAKDPARRFQEPREVAEALEPYFRTRRQSQLGALPRPADPGSKPASIPVVAERSTLLDGVFHLEGSEGEPIRRTRAGRRRPRLVAVAIGIFLLVGVVALGWRSFATRSGAAPASVAQVPAPVVARPLDQAAALGITMLRLPPGEFTMGAPEDDAGAEPNERPRHRVVIPAGRALSAHEVTVAQFRKFILHSQYVTDAERDGWGGHGVNEKGDFDQAPRFTWQETNFPQTDDHPVVNVSWNDAQEFCRWLTRKDGQTYRLPTEAEWEYACRAGSTTYYSNGDDPENLAGIANLADATARAAFPAWHTSVASDGFVHTAPVGRFRPNAWGFHDMHGNVMEWCADYYDANYYEKAPRIDPRGPSTGLTRVHRGGSWKFWGGWYNRSSDRHDADPLTRDPNLGFRVARESVGG